MNRFTFAGLMLFALLLVAPIASAQDGSPSCSGGSAYDLTGHGCVTGYTNGSTAAASIAPKVAGLAAPAQVAQQNQGWPGCPWGDAYDPMAHGYVPACFIRPAANAAAPKAAGLAAPAPAVDPEQGLPCLPWGEVYDPMTMTLSSAPECLSRPADNAAAPKPTGLAKIAPVDEFVPCGYGERLDPLALACLSQPDTAAKAASKPAGLAAPAPVAIPEQGWPGCPWGAAYDPMAHGYVPACFNRTADGAASPKTAGLAKTAPVEAFVPCGYGERLDPLALACQH